MIDSSLTIQLHESFDDLGRLLFLFICCWEAYKLCVICGILIFEGFVLCSLL